jgi:hypothetical protein
VAHLPPPVEVGDVLELGHGPILLLRVIDLRRQQDPVDIEGGEDDE